MQTTTSSRVPHSSLTEIEAGRRAGLIAVDRYDISVDFTDLLAGTTFRSTSTASFRAVPGATTFIDCGA